MNRSPSPADELHSLLSEAVPSPEPVVPETPSKFAGVPADGTPLTCPKPKRGHSTQHTDSGSEPGVCAKRPRMMMVQPGQEEASAFSAEGVDSSVGLTNRLAKATVDEPRAP